MKVRLWFFSALILVPLIAAAPFSQDQPPLLQMKHDAAVIGALWKGGMVIAWDEAGIVRLWNAASGDSLAVMEHGAPVTDVTLNRDKTRLLTYNQGSETCACDLMAKVWDVDPASPTFGTLLVSVSQPDPPQIPLAHGGARWSPHEDLIVTWSRETVVHLWDAESGEDRAALQQVNAVWDVAWNADGSKLVTVADKNAYLWNVAAILNSGDIPARDAEAAFIGHRDVAWGALWSADETHLLTWSLDGTAVLWDIATQNPAAIMDHPGPVWSALWQGDEVITSGRGVWTWHTSDVDWNGIGQSLTPANQIVGDFFWKSVWQPNGDLLASVGTTRLVGWNPATGAVYFNLPVPDAQVQWHPEGRYLITTSESGIAQVWGGFSGELLATFEQPVNGAVWSEDGSRIVTYDAAGILTLWQPELAAPVEIAQVITLEPTATPTAYAVTPTPTVPRAGRIDDDYTPSQSFIAVDPVISSADLWLWDWDPLDTEGDMLTISITDRERSVLGSVEQFIPAGFEGWLRIEFPGGVQVTPGETYVLSVDAAFGTNNRPLVGWVLDYNDPFPDGTGGSRTRFFVGYDYVYRINTSEVEAAVLPVVTVTPTATPTLVPPPATATIEAAWYMAAIFSSLNPRTAYLMQVPAGGTLNLFVGYEECCYFINRIPDLTVVWSVEPTGAAQIDPQTGVLTASADAGNTSVFVTAAAPNGLSKTASVSIYDQRPIIGVWQEEARIDCATGAFVESSSLIYELIFDANNEFRVSWSPFEVYVDYVGTYTADTPHLSMRARLLNYLPHDFEGEGTYEIDEEGRLVLRDLWLGTSPYASETTSCGHRFVRAE